MKRALMYASVASMIQQFNMENIHMLLSKGYEVDVACNMEQGNTITGEKIAQMKAELEKAGVRVFHVPVPRKLSDVTGIIRSFFGTVRLMNEGKYTLVHCHSPIGGLICRLANRFSRCYKQTRMIYTAHGFHFFKGNHPLKNLIFRTVEAFSARYTDTLITINQEDYAAAKSFRLKSGGRVEYVPGIGINLDRIASFTQKREELCRSLGIPENSLLLLSVGELNDNKNHAAVVEVLGQLPANCHYLICGQGINGEMLENMARDLGCGEQLHILGYRDDVLSVMKSCDVFVFPSKREGLSVALMEAMACGLPCFASDIRGNCDLITDEAGGALLKVDTFGQELAEQLKKIDDMRAFCEACAIKNTRRVNHFSRKTIEKQMDAIYT